MAFFHSACGKQLNIKEVACEVINFMKEEQGFHYNVVVGTDSESHTATDFITAIVVHRVGRGGRYFWRRFEKEKIPVLRQRIYEEVLLSLDAAKSIVEFLKKQENFDPPANSAEKYRATDATNRKTTSSCAKKNSKFNNKIGGRVNFSFEIHVDIGTIGETRVMISEVIGMVRGFGFDVKIKPESYAASSVADRHL